MAPGALRYHSGEPLGREIDVALERNRCLELEQLGSGEWAQRHLPLHRTFAETVPCIASEPGQDDIGHNGADAKRLAWKTDIEPVTHEAVAAIRADEIAHANDLFAGFSDKLRCHACLVLLEADEFASVLDPTTEFDEALAHHAFSQELRHHQRDVIRFSCVCILMLNDLRLDVTAVVAILPLWRIEAADRHDAVNDSQVLEDL